MGPPQGYVMPWGHHPATSTEGQGHLFHTADLKGECKKSYATQPVLNCVAKSKARTLEACWRQAYCPALRNHVDIDRGRVVRGRVFRIVHDYVDNGGAEASRSDQPGKAGVVAA